MTLTQLTSLQSAADRGRADSYYRRAAAPHVRKDTIDIPVPPKSAEWRAYMDAYYANERLGDFKDWGRAADDIRMYRNEDYADE